MHIILAILGGLGAVGVILWRISIGLQAAREIGDAAQGVANLPRKMRFESRARRQGVANITDPREAATYLMLAVARAAGEVTASQKAAARDQIARRFEMCESDADELLTHVAWMTSQTALADSAVDRMTRLLSERLTPKEAAELEAMLEAVASADGAPSAGQLEVIERVRARLFA